MAIALWPKNLVHTALNKTENKTLFVNGYSSSTKTLPPSTL